jgi:two-component system, NarL family, invasion response regulator UvrY
MKFLIVDDHFLVRKSFKITIREAYPDVTVLEADRFNATLGLVTDPEVVLTVLDIDIPGGAGTAMINEIRTVRPDMIILMCSAADEEFHALEYIVAGANGYLHKSAEEQEAMSAIASVLAGKKYVSDDVQAQLLVALAGQKQMFNRPAGVRRLSQRENEILTMLLEGKWIKEIAAALNLRPNTVSTFKGRIFQKMGVTSLFELSDKAKRRRDF